MKFNKKTIGITVVGILVFTLFVEIIYQSVSSNKPKKRQSQEATQIRPETIIFKASFTAKLEESGLWHLKYSGEETEYIQVTQDKNIPSNGLIAVAACYNKYSLEEQINNELINLGSGASSGSDFIDMTDLLETKYELREKKKKCEIRNNIGREVDFVPSMKGGSIQDGDLLGFLIDRERFSQRFVIEANSINPIDTTALVTGANILIDSNAVITDGKVWSVSQKDQTLLVNVEPEETFRKDKIYLDRETWVRVVRPIEMSVDEFENAKKTSSADIEILRRG